MERFWRRNKVKRTEIWKWKGFATLWYSLNCHTTGNMLVHVYLLYNILKITSQLILVHTQEGWGRPEHRILKVPWKYVGGQGHEAIYGQKDKQLTRAGCACYYSCTFKTGNLQTSFCNSLHMPWRHWLQVHKFTLLVKLTIVCVYIQPLYYIYTVVYVCCHLLMQHLICTT